MFYLLLSQRGKYGFRTQEHLILTLISNVRIIIKKANVSTEGEFKVRAVNECGESVSCCTVNIKQPQQHQQQQQQQHLQQHFHQQQQSFSQKITTTQGGVKTEEGVKKRVPPKFSTPIQGPILE